MDNENNNLYRLPQEKLMYSGASSLSDVELLALILKLASLQTYISTPFEWFHLSIVEA